MSDWMRAGALLSAAFACVVCGYFWGAALADARGQAALGALRAEQEEERRSAAEQYGRALAASLEQYQKQVARGDALAAEYAASKQRHLREAEALQRRIAHAVRGSVHTFSPDFVRLYNEAIGLSDAALSEALCAFSPARGTGAGGASDSRISQLFTGVTEADLLAHIVKYGRRCRGLERQLHGWRELAIAWE